MKVKVTKEAKNFLTVAEMPVVNQMIAEMKDDENTAKDYAIYAARLITGDNATEIISATAEIERNYRVYNQYGEDSGNLDIWIDFRAFSDWKNCFIIGGAYLSDICQICGDQEINEELKTQMYIRKFNEEK